VGASTPRPVAAVRAGRAAQISESRSTRRPLQVRRRPRRQGRLHAYLGARANETLAEVAVLARRPRELLVAQYGSLAHGSGVEVRRWTTCPASNIYC